MGVQVSPENFACGVFTNGSDGKMSVLINAAIANTQNLTLDDLRSGADLMFCYLRTDDGYRNFLTVRIRQIGDRWVAEVRNLAGETATFDASVQQRQSGGEYPTPTFDWDDGPCIDIVWHGVKVKICAQLPDLKGPVSARTTSGGWENQLDGACEQIMTSVRSALQSRSGNSFRGALAITRDDVLAVCQLAGTASQLQLNDPTRPLGYCYIWKERNGDDLPARIFPIKLVSLSNNGYAVDGAPGIGVTLEPSNPTIKTKSSPRPRVEDNRMQVLLPVDDQLVCLEVPLTQ